MTDQTPTEEAPLEAGVHEPIPMTDKDGTPLVQVVAPEKSWPQAEAVDGIVYAVTDPEFGTQMVAMTQKTFEDMTQRAVTLANEVKRMQLYVRSMARGKQIKVAQSTELARLKK